MPGWHDATKAWRDDGSLRMVGIVQEQHPARAALFMQWKEMGWPVLVDAQNRLGVEVVPITLLIDEHGIIRGRPRGRDATDELRAFLGLANDAPAAAPARAAAAPGEEALREAAAAGSALAASALGTQLVDGGDPDDLDEAVALLTRAADGLADDPRPRFRLGVALRRRADSRHRRPDDFQRAADAWRSALDANPNQYIWRRRLQQYGPRLDKPYPFYDWVPTARAAIVARGETPVALAVEPGEAEIARPARRFPAADATAAEPDPDGRLARDEEGFVTVETAIVASTGDDRAVRVHLTFRPSPATRSHWNNEAEPLTVWVTPPPGWTSDRRLVRATGRTGVPVSDEPRTIEFELRGPEEAAAAPVTVDAYATYNVCKGDDATCLHRRRDLSIVIR